MLFHLALANAWAGGAESYTYAEPSDCSLSEQDYYQLRDDLKRVRHDEGTIIGVAAEGAQCQKALDVVLRNGPFLGVRRVPDDAHPDACVAIVRPGPDGFQVSRSGVCMADTAGPTRMVSAGYWLPLGASLRWNEHIGSGLSFVADFGWQAPDLGFDPFDLGNSVSVSGNTSRMRGLVGLDVARYGIQGMYVGFRGGAEFATGVEHQALTKGLAEFVAGHKVINNGVALQFGGGLLAELPVGIGPAPESLYPVIEVRVGLANGT